MRKRYWIYAFLFTLTTINFIDRVALSVASSQIAGEFGLSPVEMGYLLSSFIWLYVFALIPMGIIVDKIGAKAVSGWGIALWSLATIFTGFSGGFAALIATRVAMGLGESTSYPAGGSVLRQWAPASERGTATAVMNVGNTFGPAIGAVGFAWLVSAYGWRISFVIAGALGFIWLAAWVLWYREPEQTPWLSGQERAHILETRDAGHQKDEAQGEALGLRGVLRSRTLWAIAFAHGCAVYLVYLFLTWLPTYLQVEKGLSVVRSGVFMAIPYLGAGLLAVVAGRLGDRFASRGSVAGGRRRVVAALSVLVGSTVLLMPYAQELWVVTLLFTLSLAGATAANSSNLSLVNDLLPTTRDSGTAYAFISVGGNGFGLLAPIVTGYVIKATGHFESGFIIAGVLALIGFVIMLTLTHAPVRGKRPAASSPAYATPTP